MVPGVSDARQLVGLAKQLGDPVIPHGRPLVQELVPSLSSMAKPATFSRRYGTDAFPFHTDLANWTTPPRFVLLRSATGPTSVPTRVTLPLEQVVPDLEPLRRATFYARASRRSFMCAIFSHHCGTTLLRWDSQAMRPLDSYSKKIAACFERFLQALPGGGSSDFHWCGRDEALVVDNWRVLHSRPPAVDAPERRLERVLVSQRRERGR